MIIKISIGGPHTTLLIAPFTFVITSNISLSLYPFILLKLYINAVYYNFMQNGNIFSHVTCEALLNIILRLHLEQFRIFPLLRNKDCRFTFREFIPFDLLPATSQVPINIDLNFHNRRHMHESQQCCPKLPVRRWKTRLLQTHTW